MAAVVRDNGSPESETSKALFQTRLDPTVPSFGVMNDYAASADGEHFLSLTPVGGEGRSAPIVVVEDWMTLLPR